MKKLFLILFAILFLLPCSALAGNLSLPVVLTDVNGAGFPSTPLTYNGVTYYNYVYSIGDYGENDYYIHLAYFNLSEGDKVLQRISGGDTYLFIPTDESLFLSGVTMGGSWLKGYFPYSFSTFVEYNTNGVQGANFIYHDQPQYKFFSSTPLYNYDDPNNIVYYPEGYELGDLWNVTDFPWQYGLSSNLYDITADHSTYYDGKLLYTFPVDYPHPITEFHIKYPATPQLLTMKIYDNDGIYYSYIDLDTDLETQQGGYPEQLFDFDTQLLQFRDFDLPATEGVLEKYTLVLTEQGSATPLVAREIYVGTSSQLPDDFFISSVEDNQEEVNSFCDSFPHTMSGSMIGFAYDFDFHTDDMCKLIIPPNNYFRDQFSGIYKLAMLKFGFISQTSALLSTAQVAFATTPGAPTMPNITVMGHTYSTFNFAVGASGFDFLRHLTAAAMWILTALVAFVELKSYFRGSGEEELI